MKTCPKMNSEIVGILRLRHDPKCDYAAQRIEELEAEVGQLKADRIENGRPPSLTLSRAQSLLPQMKTDPEWLQRHEARAEHAEPGTAEALLECEGMLEVIWPDVQPSDEEAHWILSLRERGSIRWLASIVLGDDGSQIDGWFLIETAERQLEKAAKAAGGNDETRDD